MNKKYLMQGIAALALAFVATSCNNDEDLYDPEAVEAKAIYAAEFDKQFGAIDPSQVWGFNMKGVTRFANTNTNQWAETVEVPATPTDEEKAKVLEVFSQPVNSEMVRNINFSDFFVQQIHKGTASVVTWPDQNGNTSELVGGNYMDHLTCAYINADGEVVDDHVNNYNNADGSIMLMQNSGTERFGYANAIDSKRHYEYVVLEIDGQYYVGFDFSSFVSDEKIGEGYNYGDKNTDCDGVYNDWIVKISPAEYKGAYRIVAEDLGTIGDFDFNDAVIDVYMDWDAAVVTVRAAGGTMPLYVNGVEIHEALGVEPNVMVNTGEGSVDVPVSVFRVPVTTMNINDIFLSVKHGENIVSLDAPKGGAPQKICVPTTFRWCQERINIKEAYPNFVDYVADADANAKWHNNFIAEKVVD